jgi:hypothetical protein
MKGKIIVVALAAVLLVCACMHYAKVDPGQKTAAGIYTVRTGIPWSSIQAGRAEIWTIDGAGLEAIFFFKEIKDGETIFDARGKKEKLQPFRAHMTPNEIMDLIGDSIMTMADLVPSGPSMAGTNVRTTNLAPFQFGKHPGFRFDLEYASKTGLEYQSLFVGAVKKDLLYLIAYTGTREHYFPKYKASAEQLFSTVATP